MKFHFASIIFLFWMAIDSCNAQKKASEPLLGLFSYGFYDSEFYIQGDIDSLELDISKVVYLELGSLDHSYSDLPKSIDTLDNLLYLQCVHNSFNEIPCGVMVLAQLEWVSFSWNPLKIIPPCIIEYSSLKQLYLVQTEIDSIPMEICQLKNLERISLGNSGVRYIPDCMANMPNLKLIDLKCDWLPEDENIELLESDREILRFSKEERQRLRDLMPNVRIIFGDGLDQ